MNRFVKTLVIATTLAATTLTAVGTASADDRRRHHRHDHTGDAIAAGVAGLAVGAIIGSALSEPPRSHRVYIDPPYEEPVPVYRRGHVIVPEPVYDEAPRLRPWTRAWFNYCSDRYRSFDPESGTFIGYDGEEHFCEG